MIRNACLVAALTMFLVACGPSPNNQNQAADNTSTTTAAAPAPKPKPKPRPKKQAPPPVCQTCGTVSAIKPVTVEGKAGMAGTLAGGAVGGLAGNQFGGGSGKAAMTALGAVAGALLGREVQKHVTSETVYHVSVRMDAGGSRTFTLRNASGLQVGSKVNVNGDTITLR